MRPIFIGLILSSSNPALANGYKDTIEQCLAAHQSGDNSRVQLIASEIKAIKMYGSMYEYHKDRYYDSAYFPEGLNSKEHEKNAHDRAVDIMNKYSDEEYFKTFHSRNVLDR